MSWPEVARCLLRLVPAGLLGGCLQAAPSVYRGVGALQAGGVTGKLVSQAVTVTRCPLGATGALDQGGRAWRSPFVVLSFGDDCKVIAGYGDGDSFRVRGSAVCSLRFDDHTRRLRLQDIMVRYGDLGFVQAAAPALAMDTPFAVDGAAVARDWSHVEVLLSGVDATDGELAFYRFFGRAAPGGGDPTLCERSQLPDDAPPPVETPVPEGAPQ